MSNWKRVVFERHQTGADISWCTSCRSWLPNEDFRPDESSRTGLHTKCRGCGAADARAWREANPEAVERYNAERRVEPTEHVCANAECAATFAGRSDATYCSKRCRDRARYLRRRAAPCS